MRNCISIEKEPRRDREAQKIYDKHTHTPTVTFTCTYVDTEERLSPMNTYTRAATYVGAHRNTKTQPIVAR